MDLALFGDHLVAEDAAGVSLCFGGNDLRAHLVIDVVVDQRGVNDFFLAVGSNLARRADQPCAHLLHLAGAVVVALDRLGVAPPLARQYAHGAISDGRDPAVLFNRLSSFLMQRDGVDVLAVGGNSYRNGLTQPGRRLVSFGRGAGLQTNRQKNRDEQSFQHKSSYCFSAAAVPCLSVMVWLSTW